MTPQPTKRPPLRCRFNWHAFKLEGQPVQGATVTHLTTHDDGKKEWIERRMEPYTRWVKVCALCGHQEVIAIEEQEPRKK